MSILKASGAVHPGISSKAQISCQVFQSLSNVRVKAEIEGEPTMRAWAERRRREMEGIGSAELARMFELIARLCELEEQVAGLRDDAPMVSPGLSPVR
jgi:hypothetical protein